MIYIQQLTFFQYFPAVINESEENNRLLKKDLERRVPRNLDRHFLALCNLIKKNFSLTIIIIIVTI